MAPVERDLRLFDELDRMLGAYQLVVPRTVRRELGELTVSAGGAAARAAAVGADLAERGEAMETDADTADAALVELAEAGTVDLVASMDGPLADRILAAGVPVIADRGQQTLEITYP